MKTIKPAIAGTINYYDTLLHRYARRLINDSSSAAELARQVLEDQYEIDKLAPSENLRLVLKTDLLNRCHYFKQSIIFDRSPVNIPLPKYLLSTCEPLQNKV